MTVDPSRPTIIQFGAGNIGRSLVGQLFSRAGWQVIFVDAMDEIVDALNERHQYVVKVKDKLPPGQADEIVVQNVSGLKADRTDAIAEAIAQADLIGTAVGPAVLPRIVPTLARGLQMRSEPISIILCENLRGAAEMMYERLFEALPDDFDLRARVGLVETSIGKMVPIMPAEVRRHDPLEVWAEAYNQIIANRDGFIGEPPEVPGLVLKPNFSAYVDRKLFIHNLGHAAAAYLGHLKDKTYIWEAVADEEIARATRGAMWEAAQALIRRYPSEFNEANQEEHIEDLMSRFANRALGDTVYRVGRDLARKLSADDRCIGALRLCELQDVEPEQIRRVIAAGLCFQATDEHNRIFAPDLEFHERLARVGPEVVLQEVCGLDPVKDHLHLASILHHYRRMSGKPVANPREE